MWAPGPGPGWFRECFPSGEELVDFVLRYLLEPNEHVDAYRKDVLRDYRRDLVARIRGRAERSARPGEDG